MTAGAGMVPSRPTGFCNPILGILLFITSEVMFFAGLFAAYFSIRAGYTELVGGQAQHVWPPTEFADLLNAWPLVTPGGQLNLVLPATLVLVASSFVCQAGVQAIRRDDRTRLVVATGVTLLMGLLFLGLQLFDYGVLASEGLTMGATTFGTTYYTLTGFHFAHVFGGVLMLGVVLYRGMAGQFSARHHDMVEATALYWHFVDVVWLVLVLVLYIL